MVSASNYIKKVTNMKVTLNKVINMVKVSLNFQMEQSLKDNLQGIICM